MLLKITRGQRAVWWLLFCALFGSHSVFAQTKIAVPDLAYKKEVRSFFYFEGASAQSNRQSSISRSSSPNDNRERAYADGMQTGSFVTKTDRGMNLNFDSSVASSSSSNYVKTFGEQIQIEYSELIGMSGEVRGALLQSGFQLTQTRPVIARPDETHEFFDIVRRIREGEFENADYVLFGVIGLIQNRVVNDPIPNTTKFTKKTEVSMLVDYSLVDTYTLVVKSAFTANVLANDTRLMDFNSPTYPPDVARMLGDISKKLSTQVTQRMTEQNFIERKVTESLPIDKEQLQKRLKIEPNSIQIFR
ncbi:MAG: hypothetical protein RL373_1163 [Pseudomonadota bacterium]|jgi:hypothetical protein|nr:hypothetical protein [Betaproteobacteria bacterium]